MIASAYALAVAIDIGFTVDIGLHERTLLLLLSVNNKK